MLLTSIILAISSSIDSFGIGITYGIKNTKISLSGKFILFFISFVISVLSIKFGNIIKDIFSEFITKLIGSCILILIGIFICFESLKKDNKRKKSEFNIFKNPISSDLDKSNTIDSKESILLAIALSLDSFCIGIGGSIVGINGALFPVFISVFQLIFLNLGIFFGIKIYKVCTIPENVWSVISGVLLIIIGIFKLI